MRTAKFYFWIAISLLAIVVMVSSSSHSQTRIHPIISAVLDDDNSQPVTDQETIRKSFSLPAGERSLEIDNVNGIVEVTGSQIDQVQVVVNKTIRAKTKEKLEEARKEVTLDASQDGGSVKLYVNGPFRCHNCSHSEDREGYSVRMDFQVQVPQNIAVKLTTVNAGHVQVKDVSGHYSVHNVNGEIKMENVAGSGTARTVNGSVKASFRESPRENSDFASVNGSIELYFPSNLTADFRVKTLNGGIFTDFPMTELPQGVSQTESHNGRFVYRTNRVTGGRVGTGGPEIKAESVNGSIRILERHE